LADTEQDGGGYLAMFTGGELMDESAGHFLVIDYRKDSRAPTIAIWVLKAVMCSTGSILPSKDDN